VARLTLLRHPAVDAQGLCYGRLDVPLAAPLDVSVTKVLTTLSTAPPRIWSSPALRCAQLAGRLGAVLGVEVHLDERLAELDFGRWEGRRWADLERDEGASFSEWMRDWTRSRPPDGESVVELEHRVRAFRDSVSEDAWVITHAGVIRAFLVLDGLPWPEAMSQPVAFLTPMVFERSFRPSRAQDDNGGRPNLDR
jgi:alpha-ribazole phosphatase